MASGFVAVSSMPQEFQRVIEDTAACAAPTIHELGSRMEQKKWPATLALAIARRTPGDQPRTPWLRALAGRLSFV